MFLFYCYIFLQFFFFLSLKYLPFFVFLLFLVKKDHREDFPKRSTYHLYFIIYICFRNNKPKKKKKNQNPKYKIRKPKIKKIKKKIFTSIINPKQIVNSLFYRILLKNVKRIYFNTIIQNKKLKAFASSRELFNNIKTLWVSEEEDSNWSNVGTISLHYCFFIFTFYNCCVLKKKKKHSQEDSTFLSIYLVSPVCYFVW